MKHLDELCPIFLGENGRLEKRLEELGREKSEMMLKLEDEILRLNSSLADKEIEVLKDRKTERQKDRKPEKQ